MAPTLNLYKQKDTALDKVAQRMGVNASAEAVLDMLVR